MADEGINWGKVVFGTLGVVATALVAPTMLDKLADVTIGEGVSSAAASAPLMDQVGEWARTTATNLNSTYVGWADSLGIGTNSTLGGALPLPNTSDFTTMNGVYNALTDAGSKAIDWVGLHKQAATIGLTTAALGGAAIGQWTSKVATSRPTAPNAGDYAKYIETRRRLAAAMPTRTA